MSGTPGHVTRIVWQVAPLAFPVGQATDGFSTVTLPNKDTVEDVKDNEGKGEDVDVDEGKDKDAAALKSAGIQARDITTANITLSAQYRYAENQPPVITGYQASNPVSIRFRNIRDSGAILDSLVAQGANQINGPSLSVKAIALDGSTLDSYTH